MSSDGHGTANHRRSWLAWLAITVCTLVATIGVMDLVPIVKSGRWPTVTGSIISSLDQMEVVAIESGKSSPHPVRQKRLRLVYSYEVNGRQYQSSQVNTLADYVRAPNRRDREQYAVGRSVVVHYDPEAPSTAVIDTSLPWIQCAQIVLSTIVSVLVWRGTRPTSPRRPARR